MNDIYSFYQLISKYQIEIPIIQRDYAQGRNNSKAEDVRKSIVGKMIKAVSDDNEPLFFDFVYGRIDGNKFIPFDGQQRLTTLFLFHKYVFEKCQTESECMHKGCCICKNILSRFSYATRQSSREFCEKIVEENIIPTKQFEDNIKETEYCVSRYIKNQPWFFPYWEKDPTVAGMIMMLDEIHKQMKSCDDFKHFAEKLTSGCNCPITFHFVDMGEHNLSDETYVKMNARGKKLTPFENFKASLEQYLEDCKNEESLSSKLLSRFKDNVDGKWLDLFWNVNDNVLPDSYMMSFVNRHFMNVWRCWYGQNTKSEKDRKDMSEDEREEQLENDKLNQRIIGELLLYPTQDDFVSWDIYKGVLSKCGVEDCLNPVFNIWNKLCDPNNTISKDCQAVWNRDEMGKKWNLFEGEKNKENKTYPSRVAFYALMRYFREDNNNAKTTLSQWMRVVWNIIENSSIDENAYQAALRLMNKLSEKCYNIYDTMANHFEEFELGNQYLAQEQVKEEVDKAKQIVNGGNDWENKIIEAEKYAFFKGAIAFLFNDVNGQPTAWDLFDKKLDRAKQIFDPNGLKKNYLIETLHCLYSYCDSWDAQLCWSHKIFNGLAATWKDNILTLVDRNYQYVYASPVHHILIGDNPRSEISDNKIRTLANRSLIEYIIKRNENKKDMYIRFPHDALYFCGDKRGVLLSYDYRNKVILNLMLKDTRFRLYNEDVIIPDTNLLWGFDIDMIYKEQEKTIFFRWYRERNHKTYDIYLMDNQWHCIRRPNEKGAERGDRKNYYCFNVDTNVVEKIIEQLQIEQSEIDSNT